MSDLLLSRPDGLGEGLLIPFCSTWLDHVCALSLSLSLSLPLKFTFLYGYILSAFLFHVTVYARGRALLEDEAM